MRTKEYFYSSTYMVTEETERIRPLLAAARAYHENQPEFFIPYSWWMDQKGWLFVRWEMKGELGRVVYRYRFDSSGSLVVEKIPVNVKKVDLLRGKGSDAPVVLITGDTHRDFTRVETFCRRFPTTKDDMMIILGDAGINFCGDPKDAHLKERLPYRFRPVDTFIQGLDQSTVDTSTEEALGHIEKKLTYKKWYAGHFHIDRETENCRIMYKQVALFMQDRDLNFQML